MYYYCNSNILQRKEKSLITLQWYKLGFSKQWFSTKYKFSKEKSKNKDICCLTFPEFVVIRFSSSFFNEFLPPNIHFWRFLSSLLRRSLHKVCKSHRYNFNFKFLIVRKYKFVQAQKLRWFQSKKCTISP